MRTHNISLRISDRLDSGRAKLTQRVLQTAEHKRLALISLPPPQRRHVIDIGAMLRASEEPMQFLRDEKKQTDAAERGVKQRRDARQVKKAGKDAGAAAKAAAATAREANGGKARGRPSKAAVAPAAPAVAVAAPDAEVKTQGKRANRAASTGAKKPRNS
jgi:hypothetical protein